MFTVHSPQSTVNTYTPLPGKAPTHATRPFSSHSVAAWRRAPSSCCSSSGPPSATSSPLPSSPEQWGHQTTGDESGAARSPPHPWQLLRRDDGQGPLPSSSFLWLRQKLGEEGPGQDLQASCLSMKIGGMFQEVIAMSVPVLNQSNPAPFQAIIGTTSKDILLTAKPGAISFSQDNDKHWYSQGSRFSINWCSVQ